MVPEQKNNPLHGITLEMILHRLVDRFGWEELGRRIRINCFISDPSIQSSLKFIIPASSIPPQNQIANLHEVWQLFF